MYSPKVIALFKRDSLRLTFGKRDALCCEPGLAKLAEFQQPFSSWEILKGNSPSDAHTREAKAAAAAGTSADLEVTIFKPPEEQLLTSALFNHHQQELVDNYGKKSKRQRKCQLQLVCASLACLHRPVLPSVQGFDSLCFAVRKNSSTSCEKPSSFHLLGRPELP